MTDNAQNLALGAVVAVLGYALYQHFSVADKSRNLQPQYADTKKIAVDAATSGGWQYFTDGTAIGPDGSYYLHDQLMWSPPQ